MYCIQCMKIFFLSAWIEHTVLFDTCGLYYMCLFCSLHLSIFEFCSIILGVCIMFYAYPSLFFVPSTTCFYIYSYHPCILFKYHILCISWYENYSMNLVLSSLLFLTCYTHYLVMISFYKTPYMHLTMCIIFYEFNYMNLVLLYRFYTLLNLFQTPWPMYEFTDIL